MESNPSADNPEPLRKMELPVKLKEPALVHDESSPSEGEAIDEEDQKKMEALDRMIADYEEQKARLDPIVARIKNIERMEKLLAEQSEVDRLADRMGRSATKVSSDMVKRTLAYAESLSHATTLLQSLQEADSDGVLAKEVEETRSAQIDLEASHNSVCIRVLAKEVENTGQPGQG